MPVDSPGRGRSSTTIDYLPPVVHSSPKKRKPSAFAHIVTNGRATVGGASSHDGRRTAGGPGSLTNMFASSQHIPSGLQVNISASVLRDFLVLLLSCPHLLPLHPFSSLPFLLFTLSPLYPISSPTFSFPLLFSAPSLLHPLFLSYCISVLTIHYILLCVQNEGTPRGRAKSVDTSGETTEIVRAKKKISKEESDQVGGIQECYSIWRGWRKSRIGKVE